MEIQDYINTVKIKLATSRIIIKVAIVEERIKNFIESWLFPC